MALPHTIRICYQQQYTTEAIQIRMVIPGSLIQEKYVPIRNHKHQATEAVTCPKDNAQCTCNVNNIFYYISSPFLNHT